MRSKVQILKTLWGVPEFACSFDGPLPSWNPSQWDRVLAQIKADGFDGIEGVPFFLDRERANFLSLLDKHSLFFVAQLHTCSYPVSSCKVQDHLDSFKSLLELAVPFEPRFVNAHSGYDGWSMEQQVSFFDGALKIQAEFTDFYVVHETHRRRSLFTPWITGSLIERFPKLRLNCDLSHWVVVCERLFDDPADVEMWRQLLPAVAAATRFIHCRVGFCEGPQVPNPQAPEYARELEIHERWWDAIVDAAKTRGDEYIYLEPEHGPAPYQHTVPFSQGCVTGDIWKINLWLAKRLRSRYEK